MRARTVRRERLPAGLLVILLILPSAMVWLAGPAAQADEDMPGTPQAQAAVTLVFEGQGTSKPPLDFILADFPETGGGGGWDGGIQYLFSPPPDLPISGAIAEVIDVQGPDGKQEESHLWVRPQQGEEGFQSLDDAVMVSATARSKTAGGDLPLEFAFHTGWMDPAGRYTLLVALRPLESRPGDAAEPSAGDGAPRGAAASGGAVAGRGAITPEIIRLQADVPELIAVSLSSGEVGFALAPGGDTGPVSCDVRITVSTNARKWSLRCLAEPITGPSGAAVPPGRLEWGREAAGAWGAATGQLAGEVVILAGDRPVEKLELPLRLTLRPQPGDPPGQYRARISVAGVVGA